MALVFCFLFFISYQILVDAGPATDVEKKFVAFYRKNDSTSIGSLYTEDCTMTPPNHPVIRGRDAVRYFVKNNLMGEGMEIISLKMMNEGVSDSGELAWGQAEFKTKIKAGTLQNVRNLFVFKKVKGEWLTHMDSWNS